MSDLTTTNNNSSNGVAPTSLWQRVTLKQVAMGAALVALIVLGLVLIVALRYVLLLLFLGIVVATALTPVVDRLRQFGLGQSLAALIAFALLLVVVVGILAALVPFFAAQIAQVAADLPTFYG